jgi:hypothetical protein
MIIFQGEYTKIPIKNPTQVDVHIIHLNISDKNIQKSWKIESTSASPSVYCISWSIENTSINEDVAHTISHYHPY